MDTDRNLLFGVLALQADLLTPVQFSEACSAWAARKDLPLAELLVERGWLTAADRSDVEKLLARKLARHGGDLKAGLAEITTDQVRQSLAGVDDAAVRHTVAGLTTPPAGGPVLLTTAYAPDTSGRYTLAHLHATGGIGRVWLARDASLGRDVALKELRPERAGQPGLWARFLREAKVTGQLEHPGIVPVYEVGRRSDDQGLFYTMRFVRGRTLAEAARAYHERRGRGEAGRLELRELLTAFVGLCQAVAYAHSRGVLHRDLKPQNVVLGDYGEVVLLDWGLAKVTGETDADTVPQRLPVTLAGEGSRDETVAGQVLGTPAYMAPEQAEGRLDLLDARTDVYGLGAVLYQVLSGQPPFRGDDTTAVLRQVVHDAPSPPRATVPAVPRALEAVCLKALAKKQADRYGTAKELAEDVKRYLADEPVSAYRDPWTTRLTRWGRRHRTLAASAAVLVLAALLGLGSVLAVQRHANVQLESKNAELAEQQAEVEARFQTAQKAIATFHTGVSEDFLLKNREFTALRTRLLKEAAGFYAELEKLLAGKTDAKSRRLLAEGYFQLGELTDRIGDQKQALLVQRKALALRREAAGPGADAEARLEVARSLRAVANLLRGSGDLAGARSAFEEQRDLAAALEAETPSDAVRAQLAYGHNGIGVVQYQTGKLAEALEEYQKARAIRQKLADANPAVTAIQSDLAASHLNIGMVLSQMGKLAEALKEFDRARAIRQRLADANPGVAAFQSDLAYSHIGIGTVLSEAGKRTEALKEFHKALAIRQKLAEANPAVTAFQSDVAQSHFGIGSVLSQAGRPVEALKEYEKALSIQEKLAEANPTVTTLQSELAASHHNIGLSLYQTGKPAEALKEYRKGRDIRQKLADANPAVPAFRSDLAFSHLNIGTVLYQTGKPVEALKEFQKALALQQQLADANPAVPALRRALADSHYNTGWVLSQIEKRAEALKEFHEARAIRQKLADANPAVAAFQVALAASHYQIGSVLSQTGKPAEALKEFHKARDVWQKLADANPAVSQFQSDLALGHTTIGRLHARQKRFTEALADLDRGLAIRRKLADAHPTITPFIKQLGDSHAYRGRAHARLGHPAEAAADLRRALALWNKARAADRETRFERSRALALLAGLAADEKAGVSAAEAGAFADQAVAALRDALEAGWTQSEQLKEADFDALRKRADFQKLMKNP
jgi:serine/threonine-protein kinase